MKTISIGRGDDADIIIDDELVSRRHATIRISPWGKMELRDFSKNGTYVNGIRLAVNKPYPVTRKDVISFARVRQLDWSEIPDPMKPYKIGAIALLVVIAALVAFSLLSRIDWGGSDAPVPPVEQEQAAEPAPEKKDGESEKAEDAKPDTKDGKKTVLPDLFPKEKEKKKDKDKDKERKDKESEKQTSPEQEKQEETPPQWMP